MSSTPLEMPLPPGRGRLRFAAVGHLIRVVKALPPALRERALERAAGGVTADLPPFADVLRLVEAAGGIPDGIRWQERLRAQRPDLAAVCTHEVSDDSDGRVRGRLYLPPAGVPAAGAALVWVHGGAFVIGSLDQQEAHWPAVELAAAGIPVLSVDYRLALRGVHFPAPHDDVLSAWRWMTRNAARLGIEPNQVHLGGASAGGCLAAGAVLALRDTHQPLPASVYLAYPVLQGDLPAPSPDATRALTAAGLPAEEWLHGMFANWAGPTRWDHPYVAPGLADPTGLPPTYVLTCGIDILRRGSEPYVARLREAGVLVRHDVFDDSRHAPLDRPDTPDGRRAVSRLQSWLTGGMAALQT